MADTELDRWRARQRLLPRGALRPCASGATMPRVATVILTQTQIRELLPMRTCIELVAEALAALARGGAQNPLRRGVRLSDGRGLLGVMPGSLATPPAL